MRSSWISQSFFDAIIRWWYVLLIGPVLGLSFAFATDLSVLPIPFQSIRTEEAPPSALGRGQIKNIQEWKEKLLFATIGVLFAGFIVYLLHYSNRIYIIWVFTWTCVWIE